MRLSALGNDEQQDAVGADAQAATLGARKVAWVLLTLNALASVPLLDLAGRPHCHLDRSRSEWIGT